MTSNKMHLSNSKISKIGLVIICALSMNTCGISYFAHRDTNPVVVDYASRWPIFSPSVAHIFATTASRRVTIIKEVKDCNGNLEILACAEPPPDVGEAFASAIAAGLQASGKVEGKAKGDIAAQCSIFVLKE